MISERINSFYKWFKSLKEAISPQEYSPQEISLIEQTVEHLLAQIREGGFMVIDNSFRDEYFYFEVIVDGAMGQQYLVSVGPSGLNLLSESDKGYYSLGISEIPLGWPVFRTAEIPIRERQFDGSSEGLLFAEHTDNGLHTRILTPDQRLQFLGQLQTTKVNRELTKGRFEKISDNSRLRSIFWMNKLRTESTPAIPLHILGPIAQAISSPSPPPAHIQRSPKV